MGRLVAESCIHMQTNLKVEGRIAAYVCHVHRESFPDLSPKKSFQSFLDNGKAPTNACMDYIMYIHTLAKTYSSPCMCFTLNDRKINITHTHHIDKQTTPRKLYMETWVRTNDFD